MGVASDARKESRDKKIATFLAHIRENGGMVVDAARASGLTLSTAYTMRDRDPEFAAAWAKAVSDSTVVLESEIARRAVHGVDEDVWHKGEVVGSAKKYSDNLLMFMTKARDPDRYRERSEVKHTGEIVLKTMTDEQINARIAALLAKLPS